MDEQLAEHVPARAGPVDGLSSVEWEPTAPSGAATFRAVSLAGEQIVTGPDWEHAALAQAVAELSDADQAFMADPFKRV